MGEIGDLVKSAIEERLGLSPSLCIKHIADLRNYKVSIEKAKNVLSFHPKEDVRSIVGSLIDNMDNYEAWDSPIYSNIACFKALESRINIPDLAVS